MTTTDTQLAELLATRLCHDLTGPISAINNGAELLEDEELDMGSDAFDLIINSAKEASNRLQFYRLAYGRVNDPSESPLTEKRDIVDAFFATTKTQVDWSSPSLSIEVSQQLTRLAMNLLIIGAGALIKGGTIQLELEQGEHGDKAVMLTASGEMLKMDEGDLNVLNGASKVTSMNPKLSQLVLTRLLADQDAIELQLEVDGEATLRMQLRQRVPEEAAA